MPTWEQHQRALGKARAAGDAEAVAEIEANISGQVQENTKPEYSRDRYTRAMDKAGAAGDVEAIREIANDWMDAAQADGRKTPRDFGDEEILGGLREARDKKDKHFETLFGIEVERRGIKEKSLLDTVVEGAGAVGQQIGDAVVGIPGAVQSGVENFGRGAARLASGEKSLGDLGGAIVDNVQTMATSIPGADLVEAGSRNLANMATGREFDWDMDEKVRARNQASAERNPLAALSGELVGAGAVANRVMQAPGLAITTAGAPGNIARTAAVGGLSEGAVSLVDTLDPVKAAGNAVVGAIAAPVVGGAVKATVDLAAPSARGVAGRGAPAGFRKLSQIVRMPVAELEAAFNALRTQRGGQNPSIAEVVNTATVQRAQSLVKSQRPVAQAAEAAAEAGEVARPQNLKALVMDGQQPRTPKQGKVEQKAFFDDLMRIHGNRPVRFNNPAFLNRTSVTRGLRTLAADAEAPIQTILNNFADAITDGRPGALRVRDVENLRVALADAIKANPSLKEALGPVRERLNTIAGNQVDEYGDGLRLYGQMGEAIKGAVEGGKAVTGSLAETMSDVSNANFPRSPPNAPPNRARRAGQQAGMRTKLGEDVGNSYGRSTRAAQGLADPELGNRVAAVQGRAEADRLAAGGAREAQAGTNLDMLNPAPSPQATRPGSPISSVADLAASAGPAGIGFKVNAIRSFFNEFKDMGMTPQAARGVAEALFDPARAEEAIRVLQRIGAWNDGASQLAQRVAAAQAGIEGNE